MTLLNRIRCLMGWATRLAHAKAKYNEAIKQKDSSMQLYWQGVVECLDGSIWGKDNAAD